VVVVLAVWLVYLTRPEVRAAAHPMRFQWAAVAAVFGAALMYAMLKLHQDDKFSMLAKWLADRFPEEAVEAGVVYGAPIAVMLALAALVRKLPAAAGMASGFVLVAL